MPFAIAAIAAAAASAYSADQSRSAGNTQADAAKAAAQTNKDMFERLNSQQAPYRQTGYNALSQIAKGFGQKDPFGADDPAVALFNRDLMRTRGYGLQPQELQQPDTIAQLGEIRASYTPGSNLSNRNTGEPIGFNQNNADFVKQFSEQQQQPGAGGIGEGQFTHQFNASDLNANLAPNWEFALKQGAGAVANAANATGGMGGNYGKGLIDYTIGKSGDLYQQAFQNYTANQTNIYNRLASVAGLGQTANAQAGVAGTSLAGNIGNAQMAGGAAQAAGQVGASNAIGQGATNAASWYSLPKIMNSGGGSNSGGYDPNFTSDASQSMAETG